MVSVEMTGIGSLPTHLAALAMEEFPHPVGTRRASDCDGIRPRRLNETRFACAKIAEEVNEEGTLDEDTARRTFQESLESLRRCTQARQWLASQTSTSISTQGSVDSSDFESL